ncbi:MAG TPA: LPXTG cell wall anchor domain-containing protein [Bryobacteraceae bacterium]|nr:LPXTG cell wall anchor domain-containing protein [Bryobacteraceae bacterium]
MDKSMISNLLWMGAGLILFLYLGRRRKRKMIQ